MKYKVTLNGKTYEVEVVAGEAMLVDEYEAYAPAPVAAAPAPSAAPAPAPAAPAAADIAPAAAPPAQAKAHIPSLFSPVLTLFSYMIQYVPLPFVNEL